MCGFVGVACQKSGGHHTWLTSGAETLTHRGPDDAGVWWSEDGRVGLAHRRLSIIDLSPAGHQPMTAHSSPFTIVFNGEIYNFIELREKLRAKGANFQSNSDTEVILAAYREWGSDCLSFLNGMFAFAIYDAQQQCVFLARDRAGEKPLFFYHANGTLRFASELKAMLVDAELPRRINAEAIDCYLAMGYVPGDRCVLDGFKKLPPAHAMEFRLGSGQIRVWRYWHLPEPDVAVDKGDVDETALLDELESLLANAVQRQLMADVPVGILLSGGVDSSLITAMAVRASSRVKTFTIRFPGYEKFDETEHARLVAQHFSTEHVELEAQPPEPDLLYRLAHQFDEPIIDSSMIPTFLVSRLVRQHCTVALGGDGGDELFGGYWHYNRMLVMMHRLGWIPHPLRQTISMGADRLLPVGMRGRNWLQSLGADLKFGLPMVTSFFDVNTRKQLMKGHDHWEAVAEAVTSAGMPSHPDMLQRATRMDFLNYLAEDILVKVDRASMMNSLEVRAPMLDYRLIEFAFGKVPSHLKATVFDKKILLKRLTGRVLPPDFDRERKQGFSIPIADWLKGGPFRELFYDVLLSSRSFFDRRTVQRLLRGQELGLSNGERIFALFLFELWLREYRVSF